MSAATPLHPRLLLLLALLLVAPLCQGQSLGLAPGQVSMTFKPGVPFEFELNVVNYGQTAVEMHVQITDLWYNQKNEKTFDPPGTSPRSAANWIQFVPEKFRVAPKGTQKMRAIVTPPPVAEGGYYATLFVESQPLPTDKKTPEGGAVFTNMRLGCLVLLTAEKTQKYNVSVGDLSVTPPSGSHELVARFNVDNQSNAHIFAVPRLAILDAGRKLVAKSQAEQKRYFPGQKDAMEVKWAGSLPAGDYTVVLTVVYADQHVDAREARFRVP